MVYLVFGKLVYLLWPFFATAQIFIVVNGQRLNKNIAIWSHWKRGKKRERVRGIQNEAENSILRSPLNGKNVFLP